MKLDQIFIVHVCGKIGGVFTEWNEAIELKRQYSHDIMEIVKIHTPQDYGDFMYSIGKCVGLNKNNSVAEAK